jgi:hypothetical protein
MKAATMPLMNRRPKVSAFAGLAQVQNVQVRYVGQATAGQTHEK